MFVFYRCNSDKGRASFFQNFVWFVFSGFQICFERIFDLNFLSVFFIPNFGCVFVSDNLYYLNKILVNHLFSFLKKGRSQLWLFGLFFGHFKLCQNFV